MQERKLVVRVPTPGSEDVRTIEVTAALVGTEFWAASALSTPIHLTNGGIVPSNPVLKPLIRVLTHSQVIARIGSVNIEEPVDLPALDTDALLQAFLQDHPGVFIITSARNLAVYGNNYPLVGIIATEQTAFSEPTQKITHDGRWHGKGFFKRFNTGGAN